MTDLSNPIKEVTKILRKYHLSYDQSKYVFSEARKQARLTPEKKRSKGTVKRLSKDEKDRFRVTLLTAKGKDEEKEELDEREAVAASLGELGIGIFAGP